MFRARRGGIQGAQGLTHIQFVVDVLRVTQLFDVTTSCKANSESQLVIGVARYNVVRISRFGCRTHTSGKHKYKMHVDINGSFDHGELRAGTLRRPQMPLVTWQSVGARVHEIPHEVVANHWRLEKHISVSCCQTKRTRSNMAARKPNHLPALICASVCYFSHTARLDKFAGSCSVLLESCGFARGRLNPSRMVESTKFIVGNFMNWADSTTHCDENRPCKPSTRTHKESNTHVASLKVLAKCSAISELQLRGSASASLAPLSVAPRLQLPLLGPTTVSTRTACAMLLCLLHVSSQLLQLLKVITFSGHVSRGHGSLVRRNRHRCVRKECHERKPTLSEGARVGMQLKKPCLLFVTHV